MRLCIIPARGGSKRIPRKNIKEFLELIDEYQSPINKEIKDDKKAEEIWALMGDLETKLEELV